MSDNEPQLSQECLDAVRLNLERYRATVEDTTLTHNSKATYIDNAERFVRWMAGDFEPDSSRRR